MPYVRLGRLPRESPADSAAERAGRAILAARPELAPARGAAARGCSTLVIDLAERHRARAPAAAVAAAEVSRRQAQRAASRRSPASRSRCRVPVLHADAARAVRRAGATAAPARPPSHIRAAIDERRHRRRLAAHRLARPRSGRHPHRRGPSRPGARPRLAGRRARRQPVRARAAADAAPDAGSRPTPRCRPL